jgi:hypothetical protein
VSREAGKRRAVPAEPVERAAGNGEGGGGGGVPEAGVANRRIGVKEDEDQDEDSNPLFSIRASKLSKTAGDTRVRRRARGAAAKPRAQGQAGACSWASAQRRADGCTWWCFSDGIIEKNKRKKEILRRK